MFKKELNINMTNKKEPSNKKKGKMLKYAENRFYLNILLG